jgi:DedD protein
VASKFQNRLVGTVILVALGVILLPGLLDGKKKHYEDEFAAIPLVPKPDDANETDIIPPVTQPLPAQPPAGAGAPVEQQFAKEAAQPQSQQPPTVVAPPPIESQSSPAENKLAEVKPKPVTPPKAEPKPEVKPKPKPVIEEQAPVGQAYVVQLGALKNAAKVNEIVAALRLSGYRAYTVPTTPVQGQITRILVGPETSKQKLQSSLPELNKITGLSGQVKAYSAR